MKKVLAATVVLATGVLTTQIAHADVSLFNVNEQNLDSSLAVRQSTTEQFDPVRGQSVADRPRPDFDPVPISMGGFQLFPAINLAPITTATFLRPRTTPTGDQVWKMNPTVTLASNWGRHAVAFTGLGDFKLLHHNNEQDYSCRCRCKRKAVMISPSKHGFPALPVTSASPNCVAVRDPG